MKIPGRNVCVLCIFMYRCTEYWSKSLGKWTCSQAGPEGCQSPHGRLETGVLLLYPVKCQVQALGPLLGGCCFIFLWSAPTQLKEKQHSKYQGTNIWAVSDFYDKLCCCCFRLITCKCLISYLKTSIKLAWHDFAKMDHLTFKCANTQAIRRQIVWFTQTKLLAESYANPTRTILLS